VSIGGPAYSGWSMTTDGFGSPPATGIPSPSGAPTNTSSSCGQLSIPR
jgi:hypothetical protein